MLLTSKNLIDGCDFAPLYQILTECNKIKLAYVKNMRQIN